MFSKRKIEPELLDHASPEIARANLADLVRINSRFGGHSVTRNLLRRVVRPDDRFSLLDVGAASGDTARLIRNEYRNATVVSLDCNSTNLEAAPQPKLLADAFTLPFGDSAFDYVFSSLFLHHFSDEKIQDLLGAFYAIARRGLLITDLERSVVPWLFMRTTGPIFHWGRITVHDGLISVRAALRARELEAIAIAAGVHRPVVRTHRPAYRLTLVAAKP